MARKIRIEYAGAAYHVCDGARQSRGGISMPTTATPSCGWQRWAKRVRRPVGASLPFSETWVFADYGDGIFIVCLEGSFAPRRGPPQNQRSAPLFAPQK